MKRTTTMLAGLGAAGALFLAGCGGSDTAAPSTSAAQTPAAQTSAARTSAATSAAGSSAGITTANSSPSSTESSMESMDSSTETSSDMSVAGPTATTTVGGDTTTLDAQSAAWFDVTCTGLAPLVNITQSASSVSDPTQLGAVLTEVGDAMTTTASKLTSTPPPTFEGGDALATQTVEALNKFGPSLSALGTKAASISPDDEAGGQQFISELQTTFSELPSVLAFDVTPELQKAIGAVPSCGALSTGS